MPKPLSACKSWCLPLVLLGFGGLLIWSPEGLAKFTPYLFVLACPLMCVMSMMFGRSCHDDKGRQGAKKRRSKSPSHDDAQE